MKATYHRNGVLIREIEYDQGNRELRIKNREFQPGDILAAVIKKITGEETCPPCDGRRVKMNGWGWMGCWRRRKEIAGWIVEEAGKRGHSITGPAALVLLRAARKEARLDKN